jgi:hypothetical protein
LEKQIWVNTVRLRGKIGILWAIKAIFESKTVRIDVRHLKAVEWEESSCYRKRDWKEGFRWQTEKGRKRKTDFACWEKQINLKTETGNIKLWGSN